MEIAVSFFCLFMFSFSIIYAANIILVLWIFGRCLLDKRIRIQNRNSMILLLLFLSWALFSILLYQEFSPPRRVLVSWIFMLQYFIVVVRFPFDMDKFNKWYVRFACALGIYLLVIFFAGGFYRNMGNWAGLNREWGSPWVPGFPTIVVLPMAMAVFLSFHERKSWLIRIFLTFTTVLIPARAGMAACGLIWAYFILFRIKLKYLIKAGILIAGALCVFLLLTADHTIPMIERYVSAILVRLLRNGDRQDIFYVTTQYLKYSPVTGFGGYTLDTLNTIYGNFSKFGVAWAHTHNWILELSVRYGLVGLFLFSAFLSSLFVKIKDKDNKFMFLLLLFLALFQTYLQNFIFIILMVFLTRETDNSMNGKVGNKK